MPAFKFAYLRIFLKKKKQLQVYLHVNQIVDFKPGDSKNMETIHEILTFFTKRGKSGIKKTLVNVTHLGISYQSKMKFSISFFF